MGHLFRRVKGLPCAEGFEEIFSLGASEGLAE